MDWDRTDLDDPDTDLDLLEGDVGDDADEHADDDDAVDEGFGADDAFLADDGYPADHARGPSGLIGDPGPATAVWHQQEQPNSCAVAAQEFVLDEFTGVDHSESELREIAREHGWYTAEHGTPMTDTGRLLAHFGIPTDQYEGASWDQLEAALTAGDGVIVGVDSSEIWNPGSEPDDDLAQYLGIPGQGADHAVEVIGVDRGDPAGPQVLLNDPGSPHGRGERVPLARFLDAWADSDHFMVTARRT